MITETLYATHHSNRQWPDEIFLITTSFGKQKAVDGLLDNQHLKRLCDELQRPMPAFDASHVLVTPGADGSEVEDARSLKDHEALANFIMTQVRNRTSDPDSSLHASLAGGRKTMTFYIGYAMSLFGRVQDTLSHVLVSDGYEAQPDFWFPTKEPCLVSNKQGQTLDASQAEITLAPIPFIRLRHNLPQVLPQALLRSSDLDNLPQIPPRDSNTVNFTDLVQLINLGESQEKLRLIVDLPAQTIRLKDSSSQISIDTRLGPLELAFYSMMARATLKQETDLRRPKQKPDKWLAQALLEELLPILGLPARENPQSNIAELERNKVPIKGDTFDSLQDGMAQNWFDSRKNKIGRLFSEQLPDSLARWITPNNIWADDGARRPDSDIDKTPKGGGYGIPLQPDQISIIEPLIR